MRPVAGDTGLNQIHAGGEISTFDEGGEYHGNAVPLRGRDERNGEGQDFWILRILSGVRLRLLTKIELGLSGGLRGCDMQFRKPLHIFIGYFVRLRNDFKAIVYHAVYNIRSISPLDSESITQPLPRLQTKVLVYPRLSLYRLRSEHNNRTFVSN